MSWEKRKIFLKIFSDFPSILSKIPRRRERNEHIFSGRVLMNVRRRIEMRRWYTINCRAPLLLIAQISAANFAALFISFYYNIFRSPRRRCSQLAVFLRANCLCSTGIVYAIINADGNRGSRSENDGRNRSNAQTNKPKRIPREVETTWGMISTILERIQHPDNVK